VLAEKLDVLRAMLHGFDYSGFMTSGHKALASAANHVLGIKDGKRRFADVALAMSKAFTLCCTLDEAKAVREEVAFFQGVKVILTKRDITQQKKTDEERELHFPSSGTVNKGERASGPHQRFNASSNSVAAAAGFAGDGSAPAPCA